MNRGADNVSEAQTFCTITTISPSSPGSALVFTVEATISGIRTLLRFGYRRTHTVIVCTPIEV